MTTPHDASATAAENERLQQIRERAAHAPTFYATTRQEEGITPRALAELHEDGTWRYWDMRSPYSDEAVDFIAKAPDDIRSLLDELDRRDRDNRELRAQLAAATAALEPFAKGAEWVGLHIGSEMERRIVAVTGVTSDDWKRAYYLLQAASPPAGAEEDGQ